MPLPLPLHLGGHRRPQLRHGDVRDNAALADESDELERHKWRVRREAAQQWVDGAFQQTPQDPVPRTGRDMVLEHETGGPDEPPPYPASAAASRTAGPVEVPEKPKQVHDSRGHRIPRQHDARQAAVDMVAQRDAARLLPGRRGGDDRGPEPLVGEAPRGLEERLRGKLEVDEARRCVLLAVRGRGRRLVWVVQRCQPTEARLDLPFRGRWKDAQVSEERPASS